MTGHYLPVPLDLLRRLAEHSREAAKLLDDTGQDQAAWNAQQAATEADEVAMAALERGQIDA
ncbi:MAG: hypothetical protein ACYTFN_24840 [Planctomycetota bacterium]|jgi:hypothetical protein